MGECKFGYYKAIKQSEGKNLTLFENFVLKFKLNVERGELAGDDL